MRVAFALLVDHATHNFMRKLAFELNQVYRTGWRAAQIPAHISLKGGFATANLAAVEAYFDTFAASIQPFEVTLAALEVLPFAGPNRDTGIVWLAAEESLALRGLHDRLNAELGARFEHTQADFDGPAYRFHATVAMGGQPPEVYQAIAASYCRPDLAMRCRVSEIMLCCAEDDRGSTGPFVTYKILPLDGGP